MEKWSVRKMTLGEIQQPTQKATEQNCVTQELLQELITASTYLCLLGKGEVSLDILESFLLTMPQSYIPQSMQTDGNLTFDTVSAVSWRTIIGTIVKRSGSDLKKLVGEAQFDGFRKICQFFDAKIWTLSPQDRKLLDEAVVLWIANLREHPPEYHLN